MFNWIRKVLNINRHYANSVDWDCVIAVDRRLRFLSKKIAAGKLPDLIEGMPVSTLPQRAEAITALVNLGVTEDIRAKIEDFSGVQEDEMFYGLFFQEVHLWIPPLVVDFIRDVNRHYSSTGLVQRTNTTS